MRSNIWANVVNCIWALNLAPGFWKKAKREIWWSKSSSFFIYSVNPFSKPSLKAHCMPDTASGKEERNDYWFFRPRFLQKPSSSSVYQVSSSRRFSLLEWFYRGYRSFPISSFLIGPLIILESFNPKSVKAFCTGSASKSISQYATSVSSLSEPVRFQACDGKKHL